MKVFIYLRKSRKDIEEEKKSGGQYDTLSRHRMALMALVRRENYDLVDEPFEEIVSGESITDRPKMQELLKRVENFEVDGVVVMDLDRLGRGDMLDQGLIDRAFRYSGTLLITPSQVYDPTSEEWELVFGIKSLVARGELKAITRRLQGGRRASAKEGKSISKKPPYGYLRDDNLILYPDPEKAWVVKKIFQMMANGHGRQAVSNELDKLNIKPPNPNREYWSPSMVTAIVKNEVYKGDIIWGKLRYVKRNGKYTRKRTDPSEWIIHEKAHEPIVNDELWEKANAAHHGRHRAPSYNLDKKLANPLAGIVRCYFCGRSMLNMPRKGRGGLLRCANPACRGLQKSVITSAVEKRVLAGLEELINQLKIKSHVEMNETNIISMTQKLIENKKKELNELNRQKNSLHDFLERGIYDVDTFIERQGILAKKIEEAEVGIQQLQNELDKEKDKQKNRNEIIPAIRSVLDAYTHTDDALKKNLLLKSVIEKVTYRREKDWKKKEQFEIHIFPRI